MGVDRDQFYDERRIAFLPMGFCFPGYDAWGGDLPPRRECAARWHDRLFALMPQVDVVLAIGGYAHRYHFARLGQPLPKSARVDEIVQKHLPARRHGVFVYSLGDEIAVRGSCLSPRCLAAYQRYLQDQYKDIAALNASWGSQYANFDQVQLSTPTDNEEAEALQSGNFPRWFDRQAYQSYNFCKLCKRFGKGFRTIDPQSRCGFEGAGTFGAADDLDGFVRSNTFWSPYPGTADEVVRSIAPRDFPRSNWMGYTKDADSLLEKYWRMVTRGTDAVWWWRWDCLGAFHGWLRASLDPYPAVQEILRDTQVVRDGLGDLRLGDDAPIDEVALELGRVPELAERL